jgi:hypothetical protein
MLMAVSEYQDEKSFLTAKQRAVCGCFDGVPSAQELERFFFLDDEDRLDSPERPLITRCADS